MTKQCSECRGSGRIRRWLTQKTLLQRLLRRDFVKELCPTCSGSGAIEMSAEELERERRQREKENRSQAFTAALTQHLVNTSLRAVEQDLGINIQQSDAKQLLAIHTDLSSHLRLLTDFSGARERMLRAYVTAVLKQCRDIFTTSGAQWSTIAKQALTKAELVEGLDMALGTTLLVVAQLKKKSASDSAIDRLIAELPLQECGSFAQDILRQMR